jgi:serine/threonine protein phosphatase 1
MAGFNPLLVPTAPPEARAPDGVTLYAIGDLHGRADLLRLLVERIRSDRAGSQDRAELIFLGDYIDRGPASYAVIDQILALQHDPDFSVTTLKGNHESLALQFLADPAVGPFWCRIGGRQTLLSYGVAAPDDLTDIEYWEAIRQAFKAALPETHLSFLHGLPLHVERGGYLFVHAGLRPGVGLAQQREWDMLWIRNEFLNHSGPFDKVVVHGHTPETQPFIGRYRIGIDTGADVTNRLTGLKLVEADRQLFTVSSTPGQAVCTTEPELVRQAAPPTSAWSPPPPAIPPAPTAGAALAPPRPRSSAQAQISAALPVGIVALAAIAYLAVPLTDQEVGVGPPETGIAQDQLPEADVPAANRDIDGAIARAERALHAAKGNLAARDAGAAATSGARSKEPRQATPPTAPRPPTRPTPEPRATAAATPPPGPPAAKPAAAPPPRAETADRKAAAPPTPKPAAPAAKPSDPSRTEASSGPEASNRKEPEPRSRASPRSSRVPSVPAAPPAATAQAPAPREETRFAGAGSPVLSASSEPPSTYTRSVPIKTANRIGQDDYPDASVQAGEEGVVGVRYVVDTRGRVSTCAATETSSHARLDKRTCELIRRRFRFKPAVRDGQPVEEVREQRIRWMLCPGQGGWGMSGRGDQRSDRPCPA